jgi:hypothetical protein
MDGASTHQTQGNFDTLAELNRLIEFHRGWKRFSSYASFLGSASSIIAAATATVVAGLGSASAAAVIAALATIFTSLEKVLQFRERWDLHRETEESLDQLRWEAATGNLSRSADLVAKVSEVRTAYSQRMSAFRVRG